MEHSIISNKTALVSPAQMQSQMNNQTGNTAITTTSSRPDLGFVWPMNRYSRRWSTFSRIFRAFSSSGSVECKILRNTLSLTFVYATMSPIVSDSFNIWLCTWPSQQSIPSYCEYHNPLKRTGVRRYISKCSMPSRSNLHF